MRIRAKEIRRTRKRTEERHKARHKAEAKTTRRAKSNVRSFSEERCHGSDEGNGLA